MRKIKPRLAKSEIDGLRATGLRSSPEKEDFARAPIPYALEFRFSLGRMEVVSSMESCKERSCKRNEKVRGGGKETFQSGLLRTQGTGKQKKPKEKGQIKMGKLVTRLKICMGPGQKLSMGGNYWIVYAILDIPVLGQP